MAISDLPILSMLRTRMQWHQERQRVLSENVANSDSPNFKPSDLRDPTFDEGVSKALSLARTEGAYISASGVSSAFGTDPQGGYEVRPAGNAVNLEDEMLKVAQNQMDYQAATALYGRSLGLIKTALGRK
jgi:flagellar basal-body rod protein FlgB